MTTRTRPEPVTPERVAPASRRQVVGLVVGVLVFAIVANFTALYLIRTHPTNGGHWLVRQKWQLLAKTPDVDTLVIGDSTCNQGVRPDIWRDQFGGTVVNLCTIGDMLAVNDAWMLEEYLRTHRPPRHVVVVHTYDMWEREANDRFAMLLGEVPRAFGFWQDLGVPIDFDLGKEVLVAAGRWFPLYSDEQSIRMWVTKPRQTFHHHEGFHLTADGYMAEARGNAAGVERDAKLHRESLDDPWHASPANAHALVALAELAQKNHLDLAIAPAPLYEGLWREPRMQRRFAEIRGWIHATVAPYPAVRVIDAAPMTFPAQQMTNVDHITDDAAIAYTTWLAARIRGQ